MLKLMGKKIITILCSDIFFILSYARWAESNFEPIKCCIFIDDKLTHAICCCIFCRAAIAAYLLVNYSIFEMFTPRKYADHTLGCRFCDVTRLRKLSYATTESSKCNDIIEPSVGQSSLCSMPQNGNKFIL